MAHLFQQSKQGKNYIMLNKHLSLDTGESKNNDNNDANSQKTDATTNSAGTFQNKIIDEQKHDEMQQKLHGLNDDFSKLMAMQQTLLKKVDEQQNKKIQVEYIWIGGSGMDIRAKTRTLTGVPKNVKDIPCWNYDGSSTGQADGSYSEIWLQPVKFIRDPFRGGDNLLCLCETLNAKDMTSTNTNNRAEANKIFEQKEVKSEEPWFGIEQEYTLMKHDNRSPLGWPDNGFPAKQGPYYCGIGSNIAYGRHVAEAHYRACLYAGLDISGVNAEVMPGQWEYQCGPCTGIDSGDQMWLSRYILNRVAEDFEVNVSYAPKPVKGDWNGAGCHTNYSTKSMRVDGGYKKIIEAAEKLGKFHQEHMEVYGRHNQNRLTGQHETASFRNFKYGVADRGASIRIPRQVEIDQKGYLEDRRPAANMDPYVVTAMIVKTTILDNKKGANFSNVARLSTMRKLF